LGDIIAYRRRGEEQVQHVCVFIAAGLVYTKNGFSFSRPWCLALAERVDDTFLGDPTMEKLVFRRKLPPVIPVK
ncbi:MAG TPA: hypothetical protein VHN79_00145, partial [Lacunisphaera sp.]|nr:hypothetical protein [Lacunisphaera sp.]